MSPSSIALQSFRVVLGLIPAAAFLWGLWKIPEAIRNFEDWRLGAATLSSFCFSLLRTTVPSTLGAILFCYIEWSFQFHASMMKGLSKHPKKPWLAHPKWANERLVLSNRKGIVIFLCVVWIYVAIVTPLMIGKEWGRPSWLFVIGGLGIAMALHRFWREWRWNNAELQMITFPGVVGGPLTAVFSIQQRFPVDTIFEASLRCVCTLASEGEDDHPRNETLWSSTIEVKAASSKDPSLTSVPLHFSIPYDCPPSQLVRNHSETHQDVRWTLKIRPRDLLQTGMSQFLVPVFRTEESRSNYAPDQAILAPFQVPNEVQALLERNGLERIADRDGIRELRIYRRDPLRLKAGVLGSLFFIGILIACIYCIPRIEIRIWACILPFFISLAALYAVVEHFFWSCNFRIEPKIITIREGIYGFRKERVIPRDHTSLLVCKLMTRGEVSEFWDLFLRSPEGKELVLVKASTRSDIESLQAWFATELGIGIEKAK